jgi:hypothetical protein
MRNEWLAPTLITLLMYMTGKVSIMPYPDGSQLTFTFAKIFTDK